MDKPCTLYSSYLLCFMYEYIHTYTLVHVLACYADNAHFGLVRYRGQLRRPVGLSYSNFTSQYYVNYPI
jgi:hypothetical protein